MAWSRKLSIDVAPPETPVIYEDEDETELKLRFAAAVVSLPPDRWSEAGYKVFQGVDNYGRAMQAATWINDPTVQIEIDRLRSPEAAGEHIPSREEMASHIYRRAMQEPDARAAAPLYNHVMDLLEYSPKAGPAAVIKQTVNVLRVPERARDAETFAERFKESQMKLVRDARSNRDA